MADQNIKADICVIGAGSGGLSVAAGAAQLGRKVVLVEKSEMGGECLNTGCVPSKAIIAAAARAQDMRSASKFGVAGGAPQIDFAAVIDHVDGVIAAIAPHDSQERFEHLGVKVLRENAVFISPRRLRAGGYIVEAKHFVVATGSSPRMPQISGLATVSYMTNETIFKNRVLPAHLIIIGGGPIGVEMAQAFRRLGSKATIIEADVILNKEDPELVQLIRQRLLDENISILENAGVDAVLENLDGISVAVDGKTIAGSHLLIATGRSPNTDGLGLEEAGVVYDRTGIKVDQRLRTSNTRIYAIGDVIGGRQFTHVAGYHASVVIKNILFKIPAKNRDKLAPRVTYTDPELAQIGFTEAEAQNFNKRVKVTRWSFKDNDRAQTERETKGFIKILAKKDGGIVGASIVGRNAGDLIQPWVLATAARLKISVLANHIAPYPTRGEANKRAAGAFYTPRLFSRHTRNLVRLLSIFD